MGSRKTLGRHGSQCKRHGFAVGDILEFVDGCNVHLLEWGNAHRYCHEKHVRLVRLGEFGKYDGWVELRALSEESKTPHNGFEVRGWLNPYAEGMLICSRMNG